jgi:hypothetical protein
MSASIEQHDNRLCVLRVGGERKKFWSKDVDPGDTGEHYSILKISESLQDERAGD